MNVTISTKTSYAYDHVHLPPTQASTFHTMALDVNTDAVDTIIQNDPANAPRSTVLPEIGDDWTEEEEQEWDSLFAQPHVQAGLSRLAEEAARQLALGEIEEGGFAVE